MQNQSMEQMLALNQFSMDSMNCNLQLHRPTWILNLSQRGARSNAKSEHGAHMCLNKFSIDSANCNLQLHRSTWIVNFSQRVAISNARS